MKIMDYDEVTNLAANDVFLIDGDRGTKKIKNTNVTKEAKLLKITGTLSSSSTTISDSSITSDMVVPPGNVYFGNPRAVMSELTITTSNGSVTISGAISGSTTITMYLEKCVNA